MILGQSKLADVPLGGESYLETTPGAAITLVSAVPTLPSAFLGVPATEILLTTPTSRILAVTSGSVAAIELAGRIGIPLALSGVPLASLVVVGLAPNHTVITAVPTSEIAVSAIVGNSLVGSTPATCAIGLTELLPAFVTLVVVPVATTAMAGLIPQPVAVTSGLTATVSLIGALSTPTVLTGTSVARIWLSAFPLIELETGGAGKVVVLNSNTLAVSEYDLDVLDVIEHEGEVYFVTATGLKKLTSNGDENINSYIQTGQINFELNSAKYIKNLSVDTSPDSSLMVTGYISQPNGDVYMFPTHDSYRDGLNQQTRVFKTPRGIRGVYWGFKFENDGTNTFDINSITLDLLDTVLKR